MLEDDAADAKLIKFALSKGGLHFSLARVETKDDYISQIQAHSPRLILAEYSLAGFSGHDALSIALEKCPGTPFIFVTGTMGEEVAIETLKSGATDYVLKTRLSRLMPAVTRALRDGEQRAKHRRTEEQLRESRRQVRALSANLQSDLTKETFKQSPAGFGSGGYIIIDMPDVKKKMFTDLLLGFQEYAELRGYAISISVDTSISNKIAFKFTLDAESKDVAPKQVRSDLKDYIDKVQKGIPLDDMVAVLPPTQHMVLFLALQNRITILQNSHDIQQTLIGQYETLVANMSGKNFPLLPAQTINILSGTGNAVKAFNITGSQQVALGDGSSASDTRIDQSIRIADSFNERDPQIKAVENLRELLLKHREELPVNECARADESLRNMGEELTTKPNPDVKKISGWLETLKFSIKGFGLIKEVSDALKYLWQIFGLPGL